MIVTTDKTAKERVKTNMRKVRITYQMLTDKNISDVTYFLTDHLPNFRNRQGLTVHTIVKMLMQ